MSAYALPPFLAAMICFVCAFCGTLVGFENIHFGKTTFAKWDFGLSVLLVMIGIVAIVQSISVIRSAHQP